MNVKQAFGQGKEGVSNSPDVSDRTANDEDVRTGSLDLVASITETYVGSAGIDTLKTRVEEVLPSIVSGEVQSVLPSSGSQNSIIGDPPALKASLSIPNSAIDETIQAIGASGGNPVVLIDDVANAAMQCAVGDIKDKAEELVLTRLRAIVFAYGSKFPIVGSYFVNSKRAGELSADAGATETTPLLGAVHDPKAFATKQAEDFFRRALSPLLSRIPDDDAPDNVQSNNTGFKILVECYALVRDGGGWFFIHLQEHSLVIAPTVSLGHLSTTDLAASTVGTAITSVTGYSIIQGFISSLDKHLADVPNRHVAKIACAQTAVITGLVLFPITALWTVHSASILLRLGQSPEVVSRVSEFLRMTAAGLPGYAIGEISKRYLTSQGLSSVHTRILSAITPLNLALNYLLVDGPIPALRLGFAGAPLCTVLSHNALAIMLIVYIVQRAMWEEVEYLRGQNTVPDEPVCASTHSGRPAGGTIASHHSDATFFTGLGTLVFAGVSGVLKSASQLWSKDFGGIIASILGPDALATQAVLLTTATTLYQAPKAMSSASSDRIKKWIAKGDVGRAKIAASVAFVSTLATSIVISTLILASATSWGKLFNNDPVIIQSVSAVLPVVAIFQVVHGMGAWADSSLGVLGKTAVFPSLSASTDYILGIPLGVYLALPRGWGLAGLWVGLSISLAYACLVATIVLVRSSWRSASGERPKVESAREGEEVENQFTVEPRLGGYGTLV